MQPGGSAVALSLVPLVTVAAGCSMLRGPAPAADPAPAAGPAGYTAAEYALLDAANEVARARVWSEGVARKPISAGVRAVVGVGFAIDNGTDRPVVLDLSHLYLDAATVDGRVIVNIRPVSVDGGARVQAGLASTIDAEFALPAGMSPQRIAAFRVRWRLSRAGRRYAQRTPFLKSAASGYEAAAFYYSPFLDPFSADPFRHRPVIAHDYPFHRRQLF